MKKEKYVLIADDNEFFPKLIQGALENDGYKVVIVDDGKLALDKIKEEIPSIFLLDLIMPKMDGFEVLDKLNESGIVKKLPILVFSNLSQNEDMKRVKELGASDYIVKQDLSFESVLEKVKSYLK